MLILGLLYNSRISYEFTINAVRAHCSYRKKINIFINKREMMMIMKRCDHNDDDEDEGDFVDNCAVIWMHFIMSLCLLNLILFDIHDAIFCFYFIISDDLL